MVVSRVVKADTCWLAPSVRDLNSFSEATNTPISLDGTVAEQATGKPVLTYWYYRSMQQFTPS